jgi:hypothetical protein
MVGRRWIMGSEELRCLDCEGLNMNKKKKWKGHIEVETSEEDELAEPAPPVAKIPSPPSMKKAVPAPPKMPIVKKDSLH